MKTLKQNTFFNFIPDAKDPYPDGEPLEVAFQRTVFIDGNAVLVFDQACEIIGKNHMLANPVAIYKNGKPEAIFASVSEACGYLDIDQYNFNKIMFHHGGYHDDMKIHRIPRKLFNAILKQKL